MAALTPKKAKETKIKPQTTAVAIGAASVSHALRGRLWLTRPHISEKTARGESEHQYTFMVDPKANKGVVKDEVERFYKVNVLSVNITRLPAKKKQWMRREGTQSIRKKAIVTLKKGQKIEII